MINFEKVKQSPISPSAISILGFCLVLDGVRRGVDTELGVAEITAGRSLDVVDGYVAKKYGLETKLGALIDAGLDKLGMAIILEAERRKELTPKTVTAAVVGQNLLNAGATYKAWRHAGDEDLKPVNDGRHAMAAQGFALLSYALSGLAEENHPETASQFYSLGHASAVIGTGFLGTKATVQYFQRAHELASI